MSAQVQEGAAQAASASAPQVKGIDHVGLTVRDIEASEAWYSKVFGMQRAFVEPHHGGGGGYAVVLHRPGTPLGFGLDYHPRQEGELFEEYRTGLDHLAIGVDSREELDAWAAHLDGLGIARSEITDCSEPFPFAVLVFRDPDNIQLELIWQ